MIHAATGSQISVVSPLDGRVVGSVRASTAADIDRAAQIAVATQKPWGQRTPRERAPVFFRYRQLLMQHEAALAQLIHQENGKTVGEACAEITRAVEVTEFACALPQMVAGEALEVSPNVECRTQRFPLGVVASISPFNFPVMVPHWTIPIALALGNAMIFKPSEKVPLSAVRTAELLHEAGLPEGLLYVAHGAQSVVEAICDHPLVKAVTFVGSTAVAQAVYRRATGNLKRALCLGGAKNHLVVLPDANAEQTAASVVASMAGCAGQRCMAAASMIAVGSVESIIERICNEARKLVPGDNLGAIISADAKARIEGYITEAEAGGAKVLVDGRGTKASGGDGGYYVGPTVIDRVTPDMRIAHDEVFGPVLSILRVNTLDEAIAIENASPYGNAAAVYTASGRAAKRVADGASAGMIGVNIGVPVPLEPFGFGGWNDSRFGVGDITGRGAIEFWTQTKKITTRWTAELKQGWMGE